MKGRSHHRLPISDPPDDWGDGSWTVDCVCGVTFDDGEEMVNCDECGVWVHTRCSRFVKGEKSFACDKCKGKRGRNNNDNSEETEVAQLLIELPNKTVHVGPPPAPDPPRRPFRLWTDIPMEERVHVQGVPGGDPALFRNVSTVFTSQLWKCTGYVPKKFNFQYREFPCWEEEEKRNEPDVRGPEEENDNPADRGADVLFSLSKEIIPYAAPVDTIGGLRGLVDAAGFERKPSPKEKRREGAKGGPGSGRIQNWVKRERNQLRPVGVHLGKRKKEDSGGLRERSGKKKGRNSDKEVDDRKGGSTLNGDAHALECREGDMKVTKSEDLKIEDKKESVPVEPKSEGQLEASIEDDVLKPSLSAKPPTDLLSSEARGHYFAPETLVKAEDIEHDGLASVRISPKDDAFFLSRVEANHVVRTSVKKEDGNTSPDGLNDVKYESQNMGDLSGGSSHVAVDSDTKPPDGHQKSNSEDAQNTFLQNGSISPVSLHASAEVEGEVEDSQAKGSSELLPSPVEDGKLNCVKHSPQHLGTSPVSALESLQVHDMTVSSSQSGEHKSKDAERESEAVSCCNKDTTADGMVSVSSEPHRCGQESEDSAGPSALQECSLKSRQSTKYVEATSKSGGMGLSPPAPSLRRLIVGVGKSSSTSSTVVLSKSSVSSSFKSVDTASPTAVKAIHFSKQRVKVKSSTDHKKENAVTDALKDQTKQEMPRTQVKDHPKSPASGLKTSQTSRISIATSASKQSASDAKEQPHGPYSKATLMHTTISSGSMEHPVSSQLQGGSSQGKHTAPGSCQKSEKINHSSSQASSKVFNHSASMHPPAPVNASATLSDEELALLLHQELNSSPRVPRVPRVRHAGSMPQLASPTATSMLAKRPSTSGGKDHTLVSRRKSKEDACKDNSRNSREQADESKRMNKIPSSPDSRRQDLTFSIDGPSKKDARNRSPDCVASVKKTILVAPTTISNPSSSIEANDQNLPSIRSSPRDMSDDDAGGVPRTLPGLIADILSKSKRMTYEGLCKTVLPHWNNLRKHNGERYAYSTHHQAVLDCLRNRNEWAQLIDRGPKTNSSRKRRKLDVESENDDANDRPMKHVEGKSVKSQQEDFPKGKRKARKRRRLTLQGRGLKEVRKRQKAEAATDDDFGLYSHSSEGTESIFSEDDSQGGRTAAVGSDASTSSADENGMR